MDTTLSIGILEWLYIQGHGLTHKYLKSWIGKWGREKQPVLLIHLTSNPSSLEITHFLPWLSHHPTVFLRKLEAMLPEGTSMGRGRRITQALAADILSRAPPVLIWGPMAFPTCFWCPSPCSTLCSFPDSTGREDLRVRESWYLGGTVQMTNFCTRKAFNTSSAFIFIETFKTGLTWKPKRGKELFFPTITNVES